jgi:GDP-L-fucose synthase
MTLVLRQQRNLERRFFVNKSSDIFVAGHNGLVGSAIIRKLSADGYKGILTVSRSNLDLTNQANVNTFFQSFKIDYVFLAAAKVGGIMANSMFPADFIRDNLYIQCNIIDAAMKNKVKKLMFLGSSCIYPRMSSQPIVEDSLLTGPLEPTNEAYAIAKIAGIKMAQAYRKQFGFNSVCVMPTNLYGPNDNFDLESSHVLPAMIRKMHDSKVAGSTSVTLWGTGSPRREFLHVDDLASALVFLMDQYDGDQILNIGYGDDVTIFNLAQMVKDAVGYEGEIVFDSSKPDGTPRKMIDSSKIQKMGWKPSISLDEGIKSTYKWFLDNALR